MSQTLSMTAMVALLQRKTGIGLASSDCVDRLNEAFRKINQMSKGGFIWQFRQAGLAVPVGAQVNINLPSDFDPGKTAILRGNLSPTNTIIPYVPMKDWVNQEHFQTTGLNQFYAWTFLPNFTAPTTYPYTMKLGPASAFPTGGTTLQFFYHSLVLPPVALGAGNYFPTPDQFDSLIVDLAVAEIRNIYRMSGGQEEIASAMQAIAEIIDTYRSDRFDLAGISDQMAQAQEKQFEGSK
jgi:hypothetical protein